MSKKIVVTKDIGLLPDQIERLKSLGDVKIYNGLPKTYDEWLERCKDMDIICTGKFGLKQKYQDLKNVFISLPFVGVGFFDKDILKKNNITVSNSPGCNKDAVSEWVMCMLLNLFRKFPSFLRVRDLNGPKVTQGLNNKKVCILGKGNIGSRVGKLCEAFDMVVSYFKRGDDLVELVKDADVTVNCLTTNDSTVGLLNKTFFNSFKKSSFFVSVADYIIYDVDALFNALDENTIAGAAIDAMGIQVGDTSDPFYKKLLSHPKVLATPHIAWASDFSKKLGADMMIDNIEAWLKGKPINLVK